MDAIRALQNQTVYGVRLQCTLSNTTTILPKRRPIPGPYGSLGKFFCLPSLRESLCENVMRSMFYVFSSARFTDERTWPWSTFS